MNRAWYATRTLDRYRGDASTKGNWLELLDEICDLDLQPNHSEQVCGLLCFGNQLASLLLTRRIPLPSEHPREIKLGMSDPGRSASLPILRNR